MVTSETLRGERGDRSTPDDGRLRSGNGYDLAPGRATRSETCLRVTPEEHVAIVTDAETRRIARAWPSRSAWSALPTSSTSWRTTAPAPCSSCPQESATRSSARTSRSTRGSPSPASSPSRREMTEIVDRRRIRHAHMVYVYAARSWLEGMRADFEAVDAISTRVRDRAIATQRIRAKSRAAATSRRRSIPRSCG